MTISIFAAGAYSGSSLGGLDYKVVLVVAQVLGYMVSKFIGIRVVAEMRPERRVTGILLLIALAWLALLVIAVLPPPFAAAMLFLNGLELGMVFGLVLGFLEGRRVTEALAAGLCASFILADGVRRIHFQRRPRREPSALSTMPHRIRMPQPSLACRPSYRTLMSLLSPPAATR